MSRRSNGKSSEYLKRREEAFNLTNIHNVTRPEYNALHDTNMRHYFESDNVQKFLYRTGQIDANGRIIDLDKNKSKLAILEREFNEADHISQMRQKDEMEMRYRVQRQRFNELENTRRLQALQQIRHDRELSRDIVNIINMTRSGPSSTLSSTNSVSSFRSSGSKNSSKGSKVSTRSRPTQNAAQAILDQS